MTAPVCLIQPDLTINQPGAKAFPSIPIAHDLHSAIQAINAMRAYLYGLQAPRPNNKVPATGKSNPSKPQSKKNGNFVEINRTTKVVRVFNPLDDTQYVDVEQIESLSLTDKDTGEKWTWQR